MKSSKDSYKIEDLKAYDDKICELAKKYGLDWHPINYEICDYYEMIGHMAYHGSFFWFQRFSFCSI